MKYCLVNRDPYKWFNHNPPQNWVVFHPRHLPNKPTSDPFFSLWSPSGLHLSAIEAGSKESQEWTNSTMAINNPLMSWEPILQVVFTKQL